MRLWLYFLKSGFVYLAVVGELLPCLYDKDIATNHVSQEGKAIGSIRLSVSILEPIDLQT